MIESDPKNPLAKSDSSLSQSSVGPFNPEIYGNKSPEAGGTTTTGLDSLIEGVSTAKVSGSASSHASFEIATASDKRFSIDASEHLSNDTITAMAKVGKKKRPPSYQVVADTQEAMEEILPRTELQGSRLVYKIDEKNVPVLQTELIEYPDLKTSVAVVAGDTYDGAINMYKTQTSKDYMPVCVLNFANAFKPGGGWLGGAQAQEEQLCYRSTLSGTLHKGFYPLKNEEVLYSPRVIVFRENAVRGYRFMNKHAVVSVISMAAVNHPNLTPDGSTYQDIGVRNIMIERMRTVLRTAGHCNHRRLALGAVGCGAFGHPPQVVADCWKEVLLEDEFHGWFERIDFIIKDSTKDNNFGPFKATLHGLSM